MKNFFNLSNFVFILFFISSCKINDQLSSKESTEILGGMKPPTSRAFLQSEMDIGRRVCSNLKKKREFFESLNNEKEQFRFKAELRNCNNELYNNDTFTASISNANSSELEYLTLREKYFRDVITDQSGILKDMCNALSVTDNVSNTALSGQFKYAFNFLIADNFDRFEIYKSKKNSDGSFTTVSIESVSVIGQKIQAPTKFFGVEKERIRYTLCEGKQYSTQKQNWVEPVTNF